MQVLNDNIQFPDISEADFDGLLAIGGDLSTERLLLAYSSGIFPWFSEGDPILWYSPAPRFVLYPKELKVSKSMKQLFRKKAFSVTVNRNFKDVILNCAKAKRKDQPGTWITDTMVAAYLELHRIGVAISAEVWQDKELVGGLYGVDLKNGVFCGESMFAKVNNASKYGFIEFVQQSNYKLIDSQVHTNHLESLGAKHISRKVYLDYLKA
ncbi:leucyl/phenylalanyl-tRNA--protein transferase [bacterium]|nr:leucyl/phenylalanyl-tRNA--protein transferase [bacterium]